MDRASQALAEGLEPGVRVTYTALSKKSKVARSTLGSTGKVVHEISGGPKDQLQIQPHKGNVARV
jgi:hypothetical protein